MASQHVKNATCGRVQGVSQDLARASSDVDAGVSPPGCADTATSLAGVLFTRLLANTRPLRLCATG